MENHLLDKTILIVDDTPENIDVLNGLLSDFKRKIATNGEKALKIALSDNPPDLILLDIMMPGMDGYEVCQKLRQDKRTLEVPVIFLTAKTEKTDIVKGFEAGGQDYVTKPFDARELMERVKTQLKLRYQQELLKNMNAVLEQKVEERTAELDKANAQLLSLDEAKNQFLMLISHEIRTPLNGIVGSTYFLSDSIDDPELQEFLEMLKESVDRLDKFSKTALEITQMQTIGRELDKKSLDINSIITKIIEDKKNSAEEKSINTIVELTKNLHIKGLENYFQRSIEELIGNAIKFSDEKTDIKVRTFEEDGNIKISVSDKGEIIPLEKIEEIIKPFGLAQKHYDKHSGLGLAYVRKYLDIHDASLEIKSNKEETVITLIFGL
ncbi:MAG: response regulator [Chlorobi bacterium]|nr:response regulator [Chlorobiota bacterium]